MKNLRSTKLRLLPYLWALLSLGACADDEEAVLELSDYACAFGSGGGVKTVYVAASREWRAELEPAGAEGFTLSEETGSLVVRASENTAPAARAAKVKVTAGSAGTYIDVVQAPMNADITIVPAQTEYEVGADGGKLTFAVSAAVEWTVRADDGWCEVSSDPDRGVFVAAVAPCPSGESRRTAVSVATPAGSVLKSITVVQSSADRDFYQSLLGKWSMECDSWYTGLGSDSPEKSGEGAHVRLSLQPGGSLNSYRMADFFMDYTVLEVYCDSADKTIAIPLGVLVTPDSEYYDFPYPDNYLFLYDTATFEVEGGYLYGDVSDDGRTIAIRGAGSGRGLGLCSRHYDGYRFYPDLYYTGSGDIVLRKLTE